MVVILTPIVLMVVGIPGIWCWDFSDQQEVDGIFRIGGCKAESLSLVTVDGAS